MEKKVSRKVEAYVTEFKKNIVQKINDLEMKDHDKINGFCQFVYNYPRINLTKEDFQKRKRVKNKVPLCYRCSARRANKEQCTRRRKEGHTLCGTHIKGTPHGLVDVIEKAPIINKTTVWAEDIDGIIYYIDDQKNVYHPQDIYENLKNPKIIAKYERDAKNEIFIISN